MSRISPETFPMEPQKYAPKTEEITVPLSSVNAGEVFRFAYDGFEDAVKDDLFFMRVEAPRLKDRVRIVNMKGGQPIERDPTHRVVKHDMTLFVC